MWRCATPADSTRAARGAGITLINICAARAMSALRSGTNRQAQDAAHQHHQASAVPRLALIPAKNAIFAQLHIK